MAANIGNKLFLTGASGYVGGEVLHQLLSSEQKFQITALVRTHSKSDNILSKTNGQIKTVIGSLDDEELITKLIFENDVIINIANSDDVPIANIFSNALTKKISPTILIHTSGGAVLQDPLSPTKGLTNKIYSDLYNNDEINTLKDDQPHRPFDKIILAIQDQNPRFIKTVIITPPLIFGFGNGYDNKISIQIPELIRSSIKNKQAVSTYTGNYYWSHVHVTDVATLYLVILSKLVSNYDIPTGTKGYYFAAGGTDFIWADVSKKIGKILYDLKLVNTTDVQQLTPDQAVELIGYEFGPYLWGTNSRTSPDLSKSIGWAPTELSSDNSFWEDVDALTKYIATRKE